jgi:hypothetical protein
MSYAEDQANAKRTDFGHAAYFVWLILLGAAVVVYELSSNGMIPLYAWLSPRVIADGPEDCWPA